MPVYRVTSGKVQPGRNDEGDLVTYGPGETFEADLTDHQVEVMEVERVDEDEGDESEPEPEPDGDVSEPEAEGVPDELTAEWVESADYPELRSAAGDYEDVNGNWGEDRLRSELLDRVEG